MNASATSRFSASMAASRSATVRGLDRTARDGAGKLRGRDLQAQLGHVALVRHPERPEVAGIALGRELAVFLEFGRREDAGDHRFLGQRKVRLAHLVRDQALRDQRFEDRLAHFGRVEGRGIGAGAEHLAQAVELAARFVRQFAHRDGRAVDAGGLPRVARGARIRIDAEERERQDQQPEEDLQEALVLGD